MEILSNYQHRVHILSYILRNNIIREWKRFLKRETNLLMKPGNQKALIRHFQLTRNACRVEEFVITHSCVGESVCLCLLWCDNGLRVKTDTLNLQSSLSYSGCSHLYFISLTWLSFWISVKCITKIVLLKCTHSVRWCNYLSSTPWSWRRSSVLS